MTCLPATPFHGRQVLRFSGIRNEKVAVQGRYKVSMFLYILAGSLQGIAERPLPCIYNKIRLNDFHGGNAGSNPSGDATRGSSSSISANWLKSKQVVVVPNSPSKNVTPSGYRIR